MDKKLLDFLSGDIRKVQKKITQEEKNKLDHYLEGFEAVSERSVKLSKMTNLKKFAPEMTDKYTSGVETHRLEGHFDMATASLMAGLTNVVTIHTDNLGLTYRGLGQDLNVHAIGHLENRGDTGSAPREGSKQSGLDEGTRLRNEIRDFHINLIAGMANKLKAVPEGDGNMLDNTLIVYISESGSTQHTSTSLTFPLFTVGKLGGKFKSGRYINYPSWGQKGHRTLSNFHTSILHGVGHPRDHFGNYDITMPKEIDQNGVLNELYNG
jgi:hypothetical protein